MAINSKIKTKNRLAPPEASALFTIVDPNSHVAEQYRTVRTNILYSGVDQKTQSIIVTSSGPSEGKSTTASNLAVVFAQSGMNTLLVDADMRRPTTHRTFDMENNKGLSNLLSIRSLSVSDVVQISDIKNLDILTSGPISPSPSELLASARMKKVIQILKKEYDFIIFDVPPLGNVTDAQLVASQVDGVLLVVQENKTEKAPLAQAVKMLEQVDATILGSIYRGELNDTTYGYYQ